MKYLDSRNLKGVCDINTSGGPSHRVHTEWQWSISSVHSIMMGKISGGGWGCTPTPSQSFFHHAQSCSVRYALAERADTLPVFHLYPYVLCVPSVEVHGTLCTALADIFKPSSYELTEVPKYRLRSSEK
jgi:hypothetical protein